jgi:hypothetical protein
MPALDVFPDNVLVVPENFSGKILQMLGDQPLLLGHTLVSFVCFRSFPAQVVSDLAELFEGGFQIFDDFLGEDVGIREVVGFFEAFVSEPEDI